MNKKDKDKASELLHRQHFIIKLEQTSAATNNQN